MNPLPNLTPAGGENRAAPLEALELPETPTRLHYRRNHFKYPEVDPGAWTLEIDGAVQHPSTLSLADLRRYSRETLTVLLECAGHRRTEYDPRPSGVPWELGALSQARWTGVRLADVLRTVGIREGAREVVLYGADRGPFVGVEGEHSFARALPLEKALHPDTLLALEMNGELLPAEHGAPLRAVVPGWYAMDSVKWLTRIEVVTDPFRGPFQELDYRFIPEGDTGLGERLTQIPVHSLFVDADASCAHGIAWGGEGVEIVEVRIDDGSWQPARVTRARSPYERSTWTADLNLAPGEHVLAVRATDQTGGAQPEQPTWNRRGYANNSVQHIQIRVG